MGDIQSKWYTLSVILNRVKDIFDSSISGKHFWLKVEIAQIKHDRRGHYYLELVENKNGITLAKSRATIWNMFAKEIQKNLGDQKHNILKEGAEILCECEVVFSQVYGMSINIVQVDLSFSLGEVERKKQLALQELKKQGLLELNKSIALRDVIQNIAVLGSKNTAGYADFIKHLEQNEHGFKFYTTSFDTIVQGDNAPNRIIEQFYRIKPNEFDVIVLLRGGGAAMDLDVFNNLALAKVIANSHTPVFTAIGHQTDISVVDFVANQSFKTPSAAAAYIIERAYMFNNKVQSIYQNIMQCYTRGISEASTTLQARANALKALVDINCQNKQNLLKLQASSLSYMTVNLFEKTKLDLTLFSQDIVQQATLGISAKKAELKQDSNLLLMYSSSLGQSQSYLLKSKLQTLEFYIENLLKKQHIELDKFMSIVQSYDLDQALKNGFCVAMHNGKIINANTQLKPNDVIELQLYNKAYLITIKDIKQIELWKNLPTNQQVKS